MEERRHVRFKLVVPVVLCWTSADRHKCEATGVTSNISSGGIFLSSERQIEIGTKPRFELRVAPAITLEGWGLVIRSKQHDGKFEYGIQATSMRVTKRNGESAGTALAALDRLAQSS